MGDRHGTENPGRAAMDRLPADGLPPLAAQVDAVLADYGYEMAPAIDAIDDAIAGFGGLFAPQTSDDERRAALEAVLSSGPPQPSPSLPAAPPQVVLYVDGSSRGNPGAAGAGAVLQVADTHAVRLGRPVGARTGNNVAEYAALHLGLAALVSRCDPASVEVRIDSMTVVDTVWGDDPAPESVAAYVTAIDDLRSTLPTCEWTHLVDSDPNPADARATVGADIAALGPG